MFIEAIILGLIIGYIRKGSIENLGYIKIKGTALILLAGIIQGLPFILYRFNIAYEVLKWFTPASLIILLICILMNFSKKGTKFIFVGILLNLIVVLINDMKMPVLFKALKISGLEHMAMPIKMGDAINCMPFENSWGITGYMGKIIPIPEVYPLARVLSLGDIFIAIGIVIFVSKSMKRHYFKRYH